MLAMMVSTVLILGLILFSAQRTKNQIIREANTLNSVQAQTHEASVTLANMEAQTLGIEFIRMDEGMAIFLPDHLKFQRPPANIRGGVRVPEEKGLYWIEER